VPGSPGVSSAAPPSPAAAAPEGSKLAAVSSQQQRRRASAALDGAEGWATNSRAVLALGKGKGSKKGPGDRRFHWPPRGDHGGDGGFQVRRS
jgi:hypothetical protein